ncbi:MAG: alpha-2-macroglobulin, partial [Prolixibacteraceae bacterium]|nr:alpha-2-macroglobulin [Prolixibacteraceae bacterium]
WEASVTAFGIEGSNIAKLELSGMPPLNLGKRLEFLISYPHGCVEQTTSAVFPQLYLPKLIELSEEDRSKVSFNIEKGIEKLQRFQTSDGGFSYWPGSSYSTDWGSCYAGHFLLEAEKAGYLVPGNLKNNWLGYMRRSASDFSGNQRYSYSRYTQAYRLFLLAKAGEPQISAMNRLRAEKDLDNQTKWLLAGAYSLAGMKEAAYNLIDFRNMKPDKSYAYCYGSYLREQSIMLQTLVVLNEIDQASKLAMDISKQLSAQTWYSTQSTAYALVALSNMAQATGADKTMEYRLTLNGKTEKQKSKDYIQQIQLNYNDNGNAGLKIENTGEGTLFINLSNEGVKAGVDAGSEEKGLQLAVGYFDKKFNKIDPETIKQGDDFITKVSVYNKTGIRVSDVALNQLFPAGWEIVNSRLFETASGSQKNSAFDYQDIRDDRVYTYFGLGGYETKTFIIHLNASYVGEYILSPVTCEAMYDDSYFAKVPGQKVKVAKE